MEGPLTRHHVNQIQIPLSRMTCLLRNYFTWWLGAVEFMDMLIYGQKSINYNMFSVITCQLGLNYYGSCVLILLLLSAFF